MSGWQLGGKEELRKAVCEDVFCPLLLSHVTSSGMLPNASFLFLSCVPQGGKMLHCPLRGRWRVFPLDVITRHFIRCHETRPLLVDSQHWKVLSVLFPNQFRVKAQFTSAVYFFSEISLERWHIVTRMSKVQKCSSSGAKFWYQSPVLQYISTEGLCRVKC